MSLSRFPVPGRSLLVEHLSRAIVSITVILASLAAVTFMSSPVWGQASDDVHLVPRQPSTPTEQPATSSSGPSVAADLRVRVSAPAFVKNVELVMVPVMITNPLNQVVTGLQKDNFRVYEGDQEQAVRYFSSEDAPLSLGVIFDVSESMTTKIEKAREAVIDFFRIANPQDEFCLVTFSDRPHFLVDFGEPIEAIERKLDYATPKGRTALLDAIYMGMAKMRQARHFRKALLIISDGADNTSRFSAREIKELVMESDVQIYAISISTSFFKTVEELRGKRLLGRLSEATGGRALTAHKASELPAIAAQIGMELRSQYVLGYRLPKFGRDGRWRKIKVSLVPPGGSPPLRVHVKTGYYGPGQ
jgi:Ca-activated chloride channel homolog